MKPTAPHRVLIVTALAMLAFAGNSLLCRLALKLTTIEPLMFTTIRLLSGAVVLCAVLLLTRRRPAVAGAGSWWSAAWLFVYAAAFSMAYVRLPTGTGALLLFASVQITMFSAGIWSGERISLPKGAGLTIAMGGLVWLLFPGISAPPAASAAWMIASGVAWGIYSLRGKTGLDPVATTAGNFLRSVPFGLAAAAAVFSGTPIDGEGVLYAVISGALTSGIGYVIWYRALRDLTATVAATVQLSVPVIAAFGGAVFIGDDMSTRLLVGSAIVLGGIGLSLAKFEPRR